MFEKHVRLIMEQENLKENDARMRAWFEGEKGYLKRCKEDVAE